MKENSSKRLEDDEEESNFCQKLTTFEICLIVALCIVSISFGFYYLKTPDLQIVRACFNKHCMESSVEILNFIDTSINPCDDFYDYVCSKFTKDKNGEEYDSLRELQDQRNTNRLKYLISSPISDDDIKPIILQKQFYSACINLEEIDNSEDQIFWDLIEEIGGWPLAKGSAWEDNKFHWVDVTTTLKKLGLSFGWFLEFTTHYSDGGTYLKISVPETIGQIGDFAAHINLTIDIAVNMSLSYAVSRREYVGVESFAVKLSEICSQYIDQEIVVGTVNDLRLLFPIIPWVDLINHLTGIEVTNETEIAYNIGGYIQELNLLMSATSKRIQGNYIVWKLIEYYSQYLSEPIRKRFQNFEGTEDVSREEFCIEETATRFPQVSTAALSLQYITPEVREDFHNIVLSIKEELLYFLANVEWNNKDSRDIVVEKLEALHVNAELPDELFENEELLNYYLLLGELDFNSNITHPLEMLIEREKARIDVLFKTPINETLTFVHENSTELPEKEFEDFTYNINRPRYLNYASLGQSILSLITEKIEVVWNLTICSISELTENEEDNYLSLDTIFGAYLKWIERNEEEEDLAELYDFSPSKLFWIKLGTLQCHRDGSNKDIFNNKLQHSKYFTEAFDCPIGDAMNPVLKCESP